MFCLLRTRHWTLNDRSLAITQIDRYPLPRKRRELGARGRPFTPWAAHRHSAASAQEQYHRTQQTRGDDRT
eukprot:1594288-Pyramimonas_sp.AAC.1